MNAAFWTALFGAIAGVVLKLFGPKRGNPLAEEAAKRGAAEEALREKGAQDERQDATSRAVDGIRAVVSDADKLREYAASDPNNRDLFESEPDPAPSGRGSDSGGQT